MIEDWEGRPNGHNWFLIILILILVSLLLVGIILTFKVDISNFIEDNIETRVEEVPETFCTKEQVTDIFREIYKVVNDPDAITIEFEFGEGHDGSSKLMIITTDENENVNHYSYRSDCMD